MRRAAIGDGVSTRRAGRRSAGPSLTCMLVAAWMLGCNAMQSPAAPAASPTATCHAMAYAGATGGERIQNAINDTSCSTVEVDAGGPDAGGTWSIVKPVVLRSNVILEGVGAPQPTLVAAARFSGTGLLSLVGVSTVTVRNLTLANNSISPNGIWIQGSRTIAISRGAISGGLFHAVHLNTIASTDVRISEMVMSDNVNIGVRTDTPDPSTFHARIVVRNNTMTGSKYGAALANCGNSPATACEISDNTITNAAESGLDLNRSHHATVSGNSVLAPCGVGITIDDVLNAQIARNKVSGCDSYGIALANGALPENQPWTLSGNQVTNNTVEDNGGYGLVSYRTRANAADRNEANVWADNRISGNAGGGCDTNAEQNTFTGNGPQACKPQR
jgi:Right handed beta helix region